MLIHRKYRYRSLGLVYNEIPAENEEFVEILYSLPLKATCRV